MNYNEFYTINAEQYMSNHDQFNAIVDTWKNYRQKILNEELSAEEYNAKNEFFEEGKYSLRQFIEHTCATDYFGTLGTIKSSELGLWVTGKTDNKIYRFNHKATNKDLTNDEIDLYTKQTNQFLKSLVTQYKWDDLLKFLRTDKTFEIIGYPSFIFGIVFLNSILKDEDLTQEEKNNNYHFDYQYGLVWIYKYDVIVKNKEFKSLATLKDDNSKLIPFVQSKALCEKCKKLCGIDDRDMNADKVMLFERTVWAFTHDISKMENNIIKVINENNKQIILTGAPGTGKTYAAQKIATVDEDSAIISKGIDKNGECIDIKYQFVQFHPSFDYSDFVEGLRPVNIKGNTTFVRMDGVFKEFCRKAAFDYAKNADDNYNTRFYFIIDEVNRADLSKVFGELMYCFEYRGNAGKVKTQYSNIDTYIITKYGPMTFPEIKNYNEAEKDETKKIDVSIFGDSDIFEDGFYIPENVYIIGTMNDIDRSVESFDFALRRRFKWFEIKATDVMDDILPKIISDKKAYDFVKEKIKSLNEYISNPEKNDMGLSDDYNVGPAYFKYYGERTGGNYKTKLANIYRSDIEATLKEYVRGRDQASINDFLKGCRTKFGLDDKYKWLKESDNEQSQGAPATDAIGEIQDNHE